MLNIVLFGPPGSGKGTQSEKVIEKYGLSHISTGDILRKAIANKTELGVKAKQFMDNGKLVPDADVQQMLANHIEKNMDVKGFIFDGFPRTATQAEFLCEFLKSIDTDIKVMVALDVDEDELVTRLLERGKQSGRSDDNLETIKKRIAVYHKQTAPAIDYYSNLGKYEPVNGAGSVDDIFARIDEKIEKYK